MQTSESFSSSAQGNMDSDRRESRQRRQIVCFAICTQSFGIDIGAVREIRAWSAPTALPNAPGFVRGVINLRGTIVPILDLRARFNQGHMEPAKAHVVIVVQVGHRLTGMLADTVSDIVKVAADDVREIPDIGGSEAKECPDGLIAAEERMIAVVSAERILSLIAHDGTA